MIYDLNWYQSYSLADSLFFDAMFYWIKAIVKIVKFLFKTFDMIMFLCIKGTI